MSLDIAKGMHYLHTCNLPLCMEVTHHHIISYHIISYHIISYHIILYHITLYHIILYCLSIVLLHMRYTRHVTKRIAAWSDIFWSRSLNTNFVLCLLEAYLCFDNCCHHQICLLNATVPTTLFLKQFVARAILSRVLILECIRHS